MKLSDASADADVVGVICGPTASGKSAIAEWLAQRAPLAIISADSRQIYRRFDIGTAKPSAAERDRVEHHGIDIIEPGERYSAAAWAEGADGWIADARDRNVEPMVVGGTGLYIRALFEGIFEEPPLDDSARSALAEHLAPLSLDELRRWVERLDPSRAHLGRTQLLRSIEVALLTGQRISALHRERARRPRWRPRYLLVDPGPVLADRIASRIDAMFDRGWPDEVHELMRNVPQDAPAWKATGYDAVRRFVAGDLSRSAAHEEILISTRQYAKRQRTWFRHQLPAELITRIDPTRSDWHAEAARWFEGVPFSARRSA
jgi:tRNA dimethylallyltransferase